MEKSDEQLGRLRPYLDNLENDIAEKFGPETLQQWKDREENWKAKVVDIREHVDLDNVYEPPFEVGKYHAMEDLPNGLSPATALNSKQIAAAMTQDSARQGDSHGVGLASLLHETLDLEDDR